MPLETSPADLIAVEDKAWDELRAPLVEVLGPSAEGLFRSFDHVRAIVVNAAAEAFLREAALTARVPGLAQQGVTAAGVISLLPVIAHQIAQAPESVGESFTKTETIDGVDVRLTVTPTLTGENLRVEFELSLSGTADGQTVRETTKGAAEMKVCPNSQGSVPMSIHLTLTSAATFGTTTASAQLEASGEATGHVSDDAELTSYTTDVTVGAASQQVDSSDAIAARQEYAEATTHTDHNMASDSAPYRTAIIRRSSQASEGIVEKASNASLELLDGLIATWFDAARVLWQHGYCVDIILAGAQDSNEIEPSSSNVFSASVRHKFEDEELNVPIEGTLSGKESLAPRGKSEAPVHYTYTAPQESGTSATVALETRSRRGVAKRTFEFRTGTPNYHPIAPPGKWSGIVCSLEKPFSLSVTGAVTGSYDFVPSSFSSGRVTLRQKIVSCELQASGTYNIEQYATGKPQADIIMDVKGQMICAGATTPVATQLRILLEPLSDPSCH